MMNICLYSLPSLSTLSTLYPIFWKFFIWFLTDSLFFWSKKQKKINHKWTKKLSLVTRQPLAHTAGTIAAASLTHSTSLADDVYNNKKSFCPYYSSLMYTPVSQSISLMIFTFLIFFRHIRLLLLTICGASASDDIRICVSLDTLDCERRGLWKHIQIYIP